jgi:hypothetical protein
MWFLHCKVILTKDILAKHNWYGCMKCCFCDQDEMIEHLFISCLFGEGASGYRFWVQPFSNGSASFI